jgi:lysophospholipase L1-like esterase
MLMPRTGFEPVSKAPQALRISRLPYRGGAHTKCVDYKYYLHTQKKINGISLPTTMEINTGPRRVVGSDEFLRRTRQFIRDLNDWILRTCDQLLIPVVDLCEIFGREDDPDRLKPEYSVGDHAHLNLEGYKRMAAAFYEGYFKDNDDYDVVVCLGDSHTQGFPGRPDTATNGEPVDPENHSPNQFPYWLAKITGKTFINRGISGNTVYGMRARFDLEVLPHQPDHCVVLGGTNDSLLGIPLEDTKEDLGKIYGRCLKNDIVPVAGTLIPLDL